MVKKKKDWDSGVVSNKLNVMKLLHLFSADAAERFYDTVTDMKLSWCRFLFDVYLCALSQPHEVHF